MAAAKPAEEPAKKKMTYGERLELERLDQEIARSEAELKMLGAEINQCGSDFTRLADLTKQQESVQQKLDEMVDRWLIFPNWQKQKTELDKQAAYC